MVGRVDGFGCVYLDAAGSVDELVFPVVELITISTFVADLVFLVVGDTVFDGDLLADSEIIYKRGSQALHGDCVEAGFGAFREQRVNVDLAATRYAVGLQIFLFCDLSEAIGGFRGLCSGLALRALESVFTVFEIFDQLILLTMIIRGYFNTVVLLVFEEHEDVAVVTFFALTLDESELSAVVLRVSVFAVRNRLVIGAEEEVLALFAAHVVSEVLSRLTLQALVLVRLQTAHSSQVRVDVDANSHSVELSVRTADSVGQVVVRDTAVTDVRLHVEFFPVAAIRDFDAPGNVIQDPAIDAVNAFLRIDLDFVALCLEGNSWERRYGLASIVFDVIVFSEFATSILMLQGRLVGKVIVVQTSVASE